MSQSMRLLPIVLGICLVVSAVQADPIAIVNPGFEEPVLADGGNTLSQGTGTPGDPVTDPNAIPGWTIAYGNVGILEASGGAVGVNFPLGGYSGSNAAFCSLPASGQSGLFGQVVGTAQAGQYTMTVKIGDRDLAIWPTDLPSPLYVELHVDSFLTPASAVTPVPDNGGFATWTKVYEIPVGSPLIGKPMSIYLGAAGYGQVQFDDVALNFNAIPEPATMNLLATGVLGLLCYAWRNRK